MSYWDRSVCDIRQCPAGHLSLNAANWECPWCVIGRMEDALAEWKKHDSAPDCVACAALDAALAGGGE